MSRKKGLKKVMIWIRILVYNENIGYETIIIFHSYWQNLAVIQFYS